MVILATLITLTGFFLYDRFAQSLTNDLENKLARIANTTLRFWWKKGVTWQDAIDKAEIEFRMCQPFIQVIMLPDQEVQNTWLFFHSSNITGTSFQREKKFYLRTKKRGRDHPIFFTMETNPVSLSQLRTISYLARHHVVIQVGLSMENTINAQRRLFIIFILGGPLLLILASIGGSFIIRRALIPVKSVVSTAQKISAENLSLRIKSAGQQDEIGQLVDTFNQMIDRLEGSVKKIRQFSGDVSHELRTPLTIIRGEIEVILRKERTKKEYRQILESILEETQQMENIIDDLLLLSKVRSANKQMLTEKFSLNELLIKVTENFNSAAKAKDINLEPVNINAITFNGKQTLIERMITNVIDNAIRYTHSGGSIRISLTKNDAFAELTVTDTGVGIPDDSLPLIFDRFYVVDSSRSKENGGTGLGLAIVKWIAENHKVEIQVHSQANIGTTFTFLFPL